jgi:Arm DNA-binding domain
MARHLIPSDTTIRTIKPGDPRKRLSDGDGLVLLLFANGSGEHGWRFDYRFSGKRNMLSLGTYPDTTLAIARRKADAVRHLLAEGFDPSQKRKAERVTLAKVREADAREAQGLPPLDSFEAVAREWYAIKRDHRVRRAAAQDAAGLGGLLGQAAARRAGGADRSPQIVRRCSAARPTGTRP